VLTDRRFRTAAQRFADAVGGEDPVQAAVGEIQSVLVSS
jgi:hypothetical protein